MVVGVSGSRSIKSYEVVADAIESSGFIITKIVHGGAVGVDLLAGSWAAHYGIPYDVYPAMWYKYGKAAGVIRNRDMAHVIQALVAVWDGRSRGTKHMIEYCTSLCKPVYIRHYSPKVLGGGI